MNILRTRPGAVSCLSKCDLETKNSERGRTVFRINITSLTPWHEEPVHPLPQYTTSLQVQVTQIVWRSAGDQAPQYNLRLQAPAQFSGILQWTSRSWTSFNK